MTEEEFRNLVDDEEFSINPGATLEAIRDREAELGVTFPQDYVDLMLLSNGLDGPNVRVEPIDEMMSDHDQEMAALHWPHLVVFGSDGAGEAFAFDRTAGMSIVVFPWVGGAVDAIPQASTLLELLQHGPSFKR